MTKPTLSSLIDEYISGKREAKLERWATHQAWLTDAANRAAQINFVSHAPKFTHGDAKGSGALVAAITAQNAGYLSTASLNSATLDVTGNAAALDVAGLLLLQAPDEPNLLAQLQQGQTSALAPFAPNPEQLNLWRQGLLQALTSTEVRSHALLKQTYFPIGDDQYHLLSPLFASSLYHEIHNRIEHARFSEEAKAAREARKNQQPHHQALVEFQRLAEFHSGGSKPQNTSLLNNKRGGRILLFSCQPPTWTANQIKMPLTDDGFWHEFGYRVRHIVATLIRLLKQPNLAISLVKQQRIDLVSQLVDELHQYAALLRSNHRPTEPLEHQLSPALSYWLGHSSLEPTENWGDQIGKAFGQQLNHKLRQHFDQIGDAELQVWRKQVEQELRGFVHDISVFATQEAQP